MTMLNMSKMTREAVDYKNVGLVFQLDVTKPQFDAGIIGKVLVFHPAFTTRATLYKSQNGIIRLSGASVKTNNPNPEMAWFNIISFDAPFREYVISEYLKVIEGTGDKTPWYQKMLGERVVEVSSEQGNESLDIERIFLNLKLTEGQTGAGMLCKVNIKTSIGSVRGYSVYKSKYGKQLYGIEQEEAEGIKAYTLSREAEAQVLNLIHGLVENWDETQAPAKKEEVVVTVASADEPPFDASMYE